MASRKAHRGLQAAALWLEKFMPANVQLFAERPDFRKIPCYFPPAVCPDPDRTSVASICAWDRAEVSLACGSRCGSDGKAARQGPAARLWIQEFESSLGSHAPP